MNIALLDAFIADVCGGKVNETPSTYKSKLLRFIRWMDAHQLNMQDLTIQHMERFRRSMIDQRTVTRGKLIVPGHLSPFTIHTTMRTVKHFLSWTYQQGWISFDPAPFKICQPPAPDPKPITADNVLALLYAAARMGPIWERARNLAMLYVLRDSAGRISAILKADIDQLDLRKGKLHVREKGDKPHVLYFNPPTIQAVATWLEFRPDLEPKDNAIFISQRGTQLTRSGFHSVMMRLREAAGLKGSGRTNAHAFRHAWARDALEAGEDLSKVSQTLNHNTIRVTSDYYARWADSELKAAHARFSPGLKLPIIQPSDL